MKLYAALLMAGLSLAALAGAAGAQVGPKTKVPKGATSQAGQAGQTVAPPLRPRERTIRLEVMETSSPWFVSPGEPVLVRFRLAVEETGTGPALPPIENAMVCDGDFSQGAPDCVKVGQMSGGQAVIRDLSLRAPAPGTAPRIILTTAAGARAARAAGAAPSVLAEAPVSLTRLPAPDFSIAVSANNPDDYWRGDRPQTPGFTWRGAIRDLVALHTGPEDAMEFHPGPMEAATYRFRCKVWSANTAQQDNMTGGYSGYIDEGPGRSRLGPASPVQSFWRTRQATFFVHVPATQRRLGRIDLAFAQPWWFEACQIDLWRTRPF